MGKFAIYRRRGGAAHAGTMATLGTADWSLSVISDTAIDVLWSGTAIPPATYLWVRWKYHTSSGWQAWWHYTGTPVHFTGLDPGTVFDFECAWGSDTVMLSEASDIKTATTLS